MSFPSSDAITTAMARPMLGGRCQSSRRVPDQAQKAADFRALHEGEPFVIPNPWDAGSARVLQALGFKALATTSSGFAFTLGRLDGAVTPRRGGGARARARPGHGPARLGGPRERLRAGARRRRLGGAGASPARAPWAARSRTGTRRPHLLPRARRRARRGRRRGGPQPGLPVHPHRPGRELRPRQPGHGRHHRAPARIRAGRRRRALRAAPPHDRGDPGRLRGGLAAGERAGPPGPLAGRDGGGRRPAGERRAAGWRWPGWRRSPTPRRRSRSAGTSPRWASRCR